MGIVGVECFTGHSTPSHIHMIILGRRRSKRGAMAQGLVVHTRLLRPQLKLHHLYRPRLQKQLRQSLALPVTVVKAEAGYGKTTAVVECLDRLAGPSFWYSLTPSDADPLIFLTHLIHAFRTTYPTCGDDALALLTQPGGAAQHGGDALDALLNDLLDHLTEDAVLVLDNYHMVEGPTINTLVERLIENAPPTLHLVLITHRTPNLRGRSRWRAYGEWAEVTTTDLAFTPEEVQALFALRGLPLTMKQAQALTIETEGWAIALQMILQSLQDTAPGRVEELLPHLPDYLDDVFAFLANEVLNQQSPEMQRFLLRTSILSQLDAQVCEFLLDDPRARERLRFLDEHSLFVIREGDAHYRYHRLFQIFLQSHAESRLGSLQPLHRRAAVFYRQQGDLETAIYHLLSAADFSQVAELLTDIAREMIYRGRYKTLAAWIDRLPDRLLDKYPELLLRRGDAARLTSRYEEALQWYRRAERQAIRREDRLIEVRALRGQAMVYLDTVQPALAAPVLHKALRRLPDGHLGERVKLLLLLAENLVNEGRLSQAERLYRTVQIHRPTRESLDIELRIQVRAGKLATARALAEQLPSTTTRGPDRQPMPRAHREVMVLLSWIGAFTGESEAARRYAEQSLRLGQELTSPILECVALARLGHAWLTGPDYGPQQTEEYYRQSLAKAEAIRVPRFCVEAHLGLTLVEGLRGHLWSAQQYARQGLETLDLTGDRYLSAVVWLALGVAGVLCHDTRAENWLLTAIRRGEQCGDRYTPCLARLWLAWTALRNDDRTACQKALSAALHAMQREGYDFMLTAAPFLGMKDSGQRIQLLQAALHFEIATAYASRLLQKALQRVSWTGGLPFGPWVAPPLEHRGPLPLYVQTLGPFRVWRGLHEIPASAWTRNKALRLFQFLLVHRHRPVHREEVMEALWPEKDPQAAAAALRVTLNALHQALEPARPPGTPPVYVQRSGETLHLNPEASLQLDIDVFERLIRDAQRVHAVAPSEALNLYRRALALYQGDFLEGCRYEDWANLERERLLELYLMTAITVGEMLVAQGALEEAIALAHAILQRDPCCEEAYGLLIRSFGKQGRRSLVLRTYERCRRQLWAHLGVEPSPTLKTLVDIHARGEKA